MYKLHQWYTVHSTATTSASIAFAKHYTALHCASISASVLKYSTSSTRSGTVLPALCNKQYKRGELC